jgi:hypothetical protein
MPVAQNADQGGAMFTVRMYLRNKQGRNRLRLTNPSITSKSVVHIAVSEATALSPGTFTPVFGRFVANANITVHNIAPQDGFVDFVVTVDFGSPLNIVTDISIFDPVPLENTVVGT